MKYFITGATGFIGGHVTRQLAAAGHTVLALARTPATAHDLAALGVQVFPGDITDKESLRVPMTGVDGVFHLAGQYKIGVRDVRGMERANIDGTRNVLEMMRELDVPKGVYTSTVGVFSNTHGQLVDETYHYTGPFTNHYERTKWRAYYEIAEPMIRDGLPLVTVLPGLVYGPGDHSLIHQFLAWYLRGWLWVVPKHSEYCMGHVEDTARGHLLAMDKGIPGESYIIAGQRATLLEMLQLGETVTGIRAPRVQVSPWVLKRLANVVGLAERVIPLPAIMRAETLRTVAGVTYLGDNARAIRELGLTLRPLEEGLVETARHDMQQMGITREVRTP
ncbi:MAG: NAD-dependent epimerase/dehydratase family protein [Chloroflexi bacterium]|nr:NAD-dependent epimerase/dehydratase family protein [Chloroflexota bacterium]